MAEIITTQADIRRSIGRMVRLEFFLRYGSEIPKNLGDIVGNTNTLTIVGDSDLVQDTDFWRYDWVYLVDSVGAQSERTIINSSSNGELVLEYGLSSAHTTAATYEIWGLWPPSDVHQKINMALRSAWRFFPNVVVNEQVIIQQDVTQYGILSSDLNNLDTDQDFPSVAEMLQIYIEQSRNVVTGRITSVVGFTQFSDSNNEWTTNAAGDVANTDFLISFYDGPGQGGIREISAWDTNGSFTVDTDVDATLTTNTLYAIWNPSSDQVDWYRLTSARFDQIENPSELYLTQLYPQAHGMRMRFVYTAQTTDLALDTDETVVPEEYLVYKALSFLYDELVGDNRHDRSSHAGLAEYYDGLAAKFAQDEGRQLPAATLWTEVDVGAYDGYGHDANPLMWSGQG